MMFSWVAWVFTFFLTGPEVADEESASWRERRFHAYKAFSRTERNADARGHW